MDVQFLLGQVEPRTSGLRWITLQVTVSPAYPHSIPFGSFLSFDDGFFPLKLAWNGMTTPIVWEKTVPIKSGDCPNYVHMMDLNLSIRRYTQDIPEIFPWKSHGKIYGDKKNAPGHSIGTSGSPSWTSTVCPKKWGAPAETWQDMARYGKMEEILHQLVYGLSHCNPIIYSVL